MSNPATTRPEPPSGGGQVQKMIFFAAAILALIWLFRSCGKEETTATAPTTSIWGKNLKTPVDLVFYNGFNLECNVPLQVFVSGNPDPIEFDGKGWRTNLPSAKYNKKRGEQPVYKFRKPAGAVNEVEFRLYAPPTK